MERHRRRAAPSRPPDTITVTATQAQNEFGRMLETASRDRAVVITKHNRPRAVLVSVEQFRQLSESEAATLDTLTEEFDALLERMQTVNARAAVRRAYAASAEDLGRAAVAESKRRRGRRGGS